MRRASFGALVLVAVLCWASAAYADDTGIAGSGANARPVASTTTRTTSAGPSRATSTAIATPAAAASSTTSSGEPSADPPAWRSVLAVLLGAALLAGVAVGTGLLGREPKQEEERSP